MPSITFAYRHSNRGRDESRKQDDKAETPSELEVIEPAAAAPKDKAKVETMAPEEAVADDKPVRRRKAPARKKAAAEVPIEAAE